METDADSPYDSSLAGRLPPLDRAIECVGLQTSCDQLDEGIHFEHVGKRQMVDDGNRGRWYGNLRMGLDEADELQPLGSSENLSSSLQQWRSANALLAVPGAAVQ